MFEANLGGVCAINFSAVSIFTLFCFLLLFNSFLRCFVVFAAFCLLCRWQKSFLLLSFRTQVFEWLLNLF